MVDSRCLILIQRGGGSPALVCVHSLSGSVAPFVRLSQWLSPNRDIWGLQAVGLYLDEPPIYSIEEMAAYYVDQIIHASVARKCILFGWSLGGHICVEMAERLSQSGYEVASVVLGDTKYQPALETLEDELDGSRWEVFFAIVTGVPDGLSHDRSAAFWQLSETDRLKHIAELAQTSSRGVFGSHATFEKVQKYAVFIWALLDAVKRYRPKKVECPLIYFESSTGTEPSDRSSENWKRLCRNGFDRIEVPGDHLALYDEETVIEIAQHIEQLLSRVA